MMNLIQEKSPKNVEELINTDYQHGLVTPIASDTLPPEWVFSWRIKDYHRWLDMSDPECARVKYPEIDFQSISYYSAPGKSSDCPKSLDEVDPQLLDTYNKLGIAVDAIFDSVSVAST